MSAAKVKEAATTILVTGDFVLDQHIYQGRRHHFGDNTSLGVTTVTELGGAALVQRLLTQLAEAAPERGVSALRGGPDTDLSGFSSANNCYAFWRTSPRSAEPDKQYWRVSEAMGFGPAEPRAQCRRPDPVRPERAPEVVVYSEGGMAFRECRDEWDRELLGGARFVLLKTTAPVAQGSLWQTLSTQCREKLVLLVSAQELRRSPARINSGLSWEETVQGVLRELAPGGKLDQLACCRHLVVTFDSEGALWLDLEQGAQARACLVFEAGSIEGEQRSATEGTAFGLLSCMAAALAWTLTDDCPDFPRALEAGLAAMRDLREKGHGPAKERPAGFPARRLAGVMAEPSFRYARAFFSGSAALGGAAPAGWSLLREAQRDLKLPAFDLARLVLQRGPIALGNLPHLKVGNLLTVERCEVEALRTLAQVVQRYAEQDGGKKPLSIGVFGPPGAGKSFAVKELAHNLVRNAGWIEFNLSQFDSPEDLNGAFHQVRDQVLQGKLPVVFFDEFDAGAYRWLQYLLAPMQDGKFQQGQLSHTLGKCIMVFAGGTSPTFETFGPPAEATEAGETPLQRDFRLAKGPDFKSRLDAYLNVLGPNPRLFELKGRPEKMEGVEMISGHYFQSDPDDLAFPLRRALMMRAQLKCGADEKLEMDEELVHALLRVRKYTHGNRSLEKILQPLAAARPARMHNSLLMPAAQLAMYTCHDEFLALCASAPQPFSPASPLTAAQVETIAPAIHETYREQARKGGWSKPETDRDFAELDDFQKDSNRAAAARMLNLLALAGMTLAQGVAGREEEEQARRHLEYRLAALAEAEHEGWMRWHLEREWRYAPKRDDAARLHHCLLPFGRLSDREKEKDRDSIRHYPDFAARAGLKLAFPEQGQTAQRGS